ncbi:MAG: hypothetical protein AAB370_12195 [Verrucomicrobiota bacterium]
MKPLYLILLLTLSACTTAPKLEVRPLPPPPAIEQSAVRYSEIVRPYHIGRYADPNSGTVMHEQHVVYRVEESARWDFHPGNPCGNAFQWPSVVRDPAFVSFPVSDAIVAEVNSQRLATTQIMAQSRVLTGALQQLQTALQTARNNEQATVSLQAAIADIRKRLDAFEVSQGTAPSPSNEPASPLVP